MKINSIKLKAIVLTKTQLQKIKGGTDNTQNSTSDILGEDIDTV